MGDWFYHSQAGIEFSLFLEHPAGAESIFRLAGKEGTEEFQAIHQKSMMDDFEDVLVGIFSGSE